MVISGISSEGHSHLNICFTTALWDRAVSGAILKMEVQGDKKKKKAGVQTEVLLRVGHAPYTPPSTRSRGQGQTVVGSERRTTIRPLFTQNSSWWPILPLSPLSPQQKADRWTAHGRYERACRVGGQVTLCCLWAWKGNRVPWNVVFGKQFSDQAVLGLGCQIRT